MTTGATETPVQVAGATRSVADCKVKLPLVAGHVSTIDVGAAAPGPAGAMVTAGTGGGFDANAGENAAVLSPAAPWLKSIPPT